MARRLTEQQRVFLHEVVVNKNSLTDAALTAYNCKDRHSAKTVGCLTMKNLEKRGVVEKEYEKYGLSKGLIFKSLADDIKKKPKNRKGELELGAKLLGMLTENKKVEHSGNVQFESLLSEIDEGGNESNSISGTDL